MFTAYRMKRYTESTAPLKLINPWKGTLTYGQIYGIYVTLTKTSNDLKTVINSRQIKTTTHI